MKDLSNKKCQDVLREAKSLFWKHGVKRVSIQEICKQANVSKVTFYKFFDNKVDLVKTIWDILHQEGMEAYLAIMAEDIPFAEKIKKTLLMKFKQNQDISQEFVLDIYKSTDPALLNYVTLKAKESEQIIVSNFQKAQASGEIRAELKMEFIMYQLNQIRNMVADETLLALYPSTQELIMELTNFFFYGLLKRNE